MEPRASSLTRSSSPISSHHRQSIALLVIVSTLDSCIILSFADCTAVEEEATLTYTLAIQDIENGKLPKWEELQAPDIAVEYWNMPEGKRSMKDLLLYIRADEAKHREVNHTLGNLNQKKDPNPFVSTYVDPSKPHPGKGLEYTKGTGWERDEVL